MCFLTKDELIAKVPAQLFRPRSFVLGRDHGWVEIVWWAVRNCEEWPGISQAFEDECGPAFYEADDRVCDDKGAQWEAWNSWPSVRAHDAVMELMSGGECLALEFYLQQTRGWFLEDAEVFNTPVPLRLVDSLGRAHNGPLRRPLMLREGGLGIIELTRDEGWSLPWRVNGTVMRRVEWAEMEQPMRPRPDGLEKWPWEVPQFGRVYQSNWEEETVSVQRPGRLRRMDRR